MSATLETLARASMKDTFAPALVFIGVDEFERINESYGFQLGEGVITHVAQSLSDSVRGRDVVARWSDDEFARLLLATPRSGAIKVAENIRDAVGSSSVAQSWLGTPESVTVSLIVAWFREGESVEGVLLRASKTLQSAKQRGCDQIAEETLPEEPS